MYLSVCVYWTARSICLQAECTRCFTALVCRACFSRNTNRVIYLLSLVLCYDHTPARRALSQVAASRTGPRFGPGWRRRPGRPRHSWIQQIGDGTPFSIRAEWSKACRRGQSELTQRTSAVYAIWWWWCLKFSHRRSSGWLAPWTILFHSFLFSVLFLVISVHSVMLLCGPPP